MSSISSTISNRVTSNYITRIQTSSAVYHVYHGNIILFGATQLGTIIIPGVFHELKIHSKYPEMFEGVESAPSNYRLPVHIVADKLTEDLRCVLANALVFIHTWNVENPEHSLDTLLEQEYKTYQGFFEATLEHILKFETEDSIKELATELKYALRKIQRYLGPYNGSLYKSIFKTQDILAGILAWFCAHAVVSGVYG